MKKSIILLSSLFLLLFVNNSIIAQNISFEAIDPQPDVKGGLFGGIELFDIDGDGDLDLYLSGREDGWTSNDHSTFYLNDGAGNFTEMMDDILPDVQFANSSFADIDDDGDQDLLISGRDAGSGFTGLFLNDGSGNFSISTSNPFSQINDGDIETMDIDDDGDVDVFLTGTTFPEDDPIRELYLNDGQGVFTELSGTGLSAFHLNEVEFGDVDGDGDLDLLGLGIDGEDNTIFSWYINNGQNNFTQVNAGLENIGGGDFAMGDLDQDGDLDVLVSGSENGINTTDVYLYLNDGLGNYTRLTTGNTFKKVDTGLNDFIDFDNDGDLDILMSGSGVGGGVNIHTTIYENFGNNVYVQADSLVGSYFSSTAYGDINGDNLTDFILTGTTVGTPTFKTWVYLNSTDISTNLTEIETQNLLVWPNPSEGIINFKLENEEQVNLEIFNAVGKLVYFTKLENEENFSLKLDLPNGIYMLSAKGKELTYKSNINIFR